MNDTLSGLKILLVEDETFIAMDIQAEIEGAGGTVVETCTTRAAAILAAADGIFDAAIVDLNLRDGSSVEVVELLLKRTVPFVISTGSSDPLSDNDWSEIPVFSKPGSVRDLVKLLSDQIAKHALSTD